MQKKYYNSLLETDGRRNKIAGTTTLQCHMLVGFVTQGEYDPTPNSRTHTLEVHMNTPNSHAHARGSHEPLSLRSDPCRVRVAATCTRKYARYADMVLLYL
jgi:hypothetical protein